MIFTNIFLRFFENSSGELSTGNTPHLYLKYFHLEIGTQDNLRFSKSYFSQFM
jgi:hypothetical protein